MPQRTKVIFYWIFVFIWMGVIFYFSSKPANESDTQSYFAIDKINIVLNTLGIKAQLAAEKWNFVVRKLAHATEYAFLGILLYFAFSVSFEIKKKVILFSFIISFLYAITDEIHQIFVPGRACRIMDIIIDASGAIMGILFMLAIKTLLSSLIGREK